MLPAARRGELGHAGLCSLPSSALRSPSLLACPRSLAAGIRRSTCTAAEARFAERTDWLGPDGARCFDCPVDPAPGLRAEQ
jgi:hypothetical protein